MTGSPKAIPKAFIRYAADVLAAKDVGLTVSEMSRELNAYAVEFGAEIPHPSWPYQAPNKQTALADNLECFSDEAKYQIIMELCDHPELLKRNAEAVAKLKLRMVAMFGELSGNAVGAEVDAELVQQVQHWLGALPEVLTLYNSALQKYNAHVFARNVLDDLRLALEKLIQVILGNSKSLEKQLPVLGPFLKERGTSSEFVNMLNKLLEYYAKYQNTYVKHDDAVIEEEIEFVLEMTSVFMKHMIRLSAKAA